MSHRPLQLATRRPAHRAAAALLLTLAPLGAWAQSSCQIAVGYAPAALAAPAPVPGLTEVGIGLLSLLLGVLAWRKRWLGAAGRHLALMLWAAAALLASNGGDGLVSAVRAAAPYEFNLIAGGLVQDAAIAWASPAPLVTITNTTGEPMSITSNANPNETGTCTVGSVVAPGASCTVVAVCSAPVPVVVANADSYSAPFAGTTTVSVVVNDTVNGAAAVTGSTVSLAPGTAPAPATGSISMATDGTITVAPGTNPGTYSYPYQICALPATTPATCASATATVVVAAPAITAVGDSYSSLFGGTTTSTVVANDTVDGASAVAGSTVSVTPGTAPTPATGSISMASNGTITVAPGTNPGTYPYPYQICVLPATSPATCASATAVITVAYPSIAANADSYSSPSTGTTTASVVANDTFNGAAAVAGSTVSVTPGTAPAPATGSISMAANGTITVAPNTAPGTYAYPHQICALPALTPSVCANATATVTVAAPPVQALTLSTPAEFACDFNTILYTWEPPVYTGATYFEYGAALPAPPTFSPAISGISTTLVRGPAVLIFDADGNPTNWPTYLDNLWTLTATAPAGYVFAATGTNTMQWQFNACGAANMT